MDFLPILLPTGCSGARLSSEPSPYPLAIAAFAGGDWRVNQQD